LFGENGPQMLSATGKLTDNDYSWNLYSNMLYIDQPVGTGFSYTNDTKGFPTTIEAVAEDVYVALQGFFKAFPQFANSDFFITGESYAGKYIPAISTRITQGNKKDLPAGFIKIQLKGLAIGNGWVHPVVQNQAYVDYPYNLGLINTRQKNEAEAIQVKLMAALKTKSWKLANNLSNELEAYVVKAAGDIDIDDVLNPESPVDQVISAMQTYLNLPEVRKSLNVAPGVKNWSFVNGTAGSALDDDEQQSILYLLPDLIANYRVLIYTGNLDMNCNIAGVEAYLDSMEFSGKEEFYDAPRKSWKVNGKLAGYARHWGNLANGSSLTNLVVRNAGHEVPFYQPENALDMFKKFISGQSFY